MERKVCAITGHRPQKLPWRREETDMRCAALKAALRNKLEALSGEGYCDFLSGMAEGVDTWAAELVLELRDKNPALKLHCILPCREQADKWSASARERYRKILDRADSVVYVNRSSGKTCMLERDRFLVDHAELLLAVYNGEPRGGTAATLRYARRGGKTVVVLPVEGSKHSCVE
ncbi:MAG: DUF1273 family protein [Oscillospiraceae bacterium]|nr:DUF1273 family protein [Oscillospiraceae bacterium]